MSNKVLITNQQKKVKVPSGLRILIRRSCNAVLEFEGFEQPAEVKKGGDLHPGMEGGIFPPQPAQCRQPAAEKAQPRLPDDVPDTQQLHADPSFF